MRTGGVKLLDFGVAKASRQVPRRSRLREGNSPICRPSRIGGATLDGRSDVFSLGVVLWEC